MGSHRKNNFKPRKIILEIRIKNKKIWLNLLKMLKEKLNENKHNSNLCFKGKSAFVNKIIYRIKKLNIVPLGNYLFIQFK